MAQVSDSRNTAQRPRRRIRAQEWELHRETIRQIYIEQEKSLAEIMLIMNQDHGFRARYFDMNLMY